MVDSGKPDLAAINRLDGAGFVVRFGGVFEHAAWVAERAHAHGPFASLDDLHAAMMRAVRAAPTEKARVVSASGWPGRPVCTMPVGTSPFLASARRMLVARL